MKCIIVDDEPIARRGIQKLAETIDELELLGSFGTAEAAGTFMADNPVDLVFLDIQMPGMNGLEFARTISPTTLIIFTTAYREFASDSYEVEALDYLVKPIQPYRFEKAVTKAITYHHMLLSEKEKSEIGPVENDFILIKSDRRFFRVNLQDILFIEALKDYVILQTDHQRLITHLNLKTIHELLPPQQFLRASRSYLINKSRVDSFSNNDVFIGKYEVAISSFYRDALLEALMGS